VKIGGFGGQGVMSAGILMANCATHEGLNATWLPSHGPEMRGGTANASVVISEQPIGSPVVDYPNVLIAMNGPSLDSFEAGVAPRRADYRQLLPGQPEGRTRGCEGTLRSGCGYGQRAGIHGCGQYGGPDRVPQGKRRAEHRHS